MISGYQQYKCFHFLAKLINNDEFFFYSICFVFAQVGATHTHPPSASVLGTDSSIFSVPSSPLSSCFYHTVVIVSAQQDGTI